MSALMATPHMMPLIALTCAVCIALFAMRRDALAAVILAPFSVNVLCFHAFVDTGLLSPSASLGILLFLFNAFFLWDNRRKYGGLW
jgi:hypothetical protein